MKKNLLLFALFISVVFVQAQIGLQASYLKYGSSDNWAHNSFVTGGQDQVFELPGNGIEASVDYRLKLKNIRIEFYPGLAFSRQEQELFLPAESITMTASAFHLFLNGRIYPLDLEGDCDCPTWRKDGPTLEKGLFLQLSAGLSLFDFRLDNESTLTINSNDKAAHFGAGLGFDLGVSDLLTITPVAMLRYYPSIKWDGLENEMGFPLPEEIKDDSNLLQFHLGLHLGFYL